MGHGTALTDSYYFSFFELPILRHSQPRAGLAGPSCPPLCIQKRSSLGIYPPSKPHKVSAWPSALQDETASCPSAQPGSGNWPDRKRRRARTKKEEDGKSEKGGVNPI